jgi:hypothetical protein
MFKVPEQFRLKEGKFASDESYGNNGAFAIQIKSIIYAFCIASDGEGFEHVSISLGAKLGTNSRGIDRCPTWEEMCFIKDLFWGEDDVVIQYHPAKDQYVNLHKYCLHLWRPIGIKLPIPDKSLIG